MFSLKTEVKISTISQAGKGLFALEVVPKGSVVFLPIMKSGDFLITEADYWKKLVENDTFPFNAGMRWVGDYFWCSNHQPNLADYINHSDRPNLLCHCGIYFALQDINIGDELTLDYREIMLKDEVLKFSGEGQVLTGLSAKETLLNSAQKLMELLKEIEEIPCPTIYTQSLP